MNKENQEVVLIVEQITKHNEAAHKERKANFFRGVGAWLCALGTVTSALTGVGYTLINLGLTAIFTYNYIKGLGRISGNEKKAKELTETIKRNAEKSPVMRWKDKYGYSYKRWNQA